MPTTTHPVPLQTQPIDDANKRFTPTWANWFMETNYSFADNEEPLGEVNDRNTEFTLRHEPVPVESLQLFLNGLLLLQGNDYSISGKTVSLRKAPKYGFWLRAWYRY